MGEREREVYFSMIQLIIIHGLQAISYQSIGIAVYTIIIIHSDFFASMV